MQVVHEVCCGLDVHKKSVTACVLWAAGRQRPTKEFGTFTKELLELADWLCACGVTHVALESTGVYRKPVWNLLEGQFEVLLKVRWLASTFTSGTKVESGWDF
jgi:transposase